MKIGIDARMLGYSGIGRYTENLIRELVDIDKKNEYKVFIQKQAEKIRNPKSEILNKSQIQNSKFKTVEIDAPIYSIKEQSNFLRTVNKEKLDVMHFTHFNRPIFYNRPSVVTIHDLTPIYFPGKKRKSFVEQFAYRLVLKTALKKAAKIIAVSNYTKQDIIKHFPFAKDKIVVIYEGAIASLKIKNQISNLKSTTKNLKLDLQNPYLLYVGVWREHKNLIGLIKAFERIKQNFRTLVRENKGSQSDDEYKNKYKNLKLVIVGKPDPCYPEVVEKAKSSTFSKDIILTGFVADSDLPILYQNAEAFVFPSFYEGFGLPPLEAMACQRPVVSSNATSLPEVLEDAALFFDPYNLEDTAQKIKEVLENQSLRENLIKKGLEQVKKYSWQKMAKETLKVYNKVSQKVKVKRQNRK